MTDPTGFRIVYEGPADDAEYWGYAQANFTLRWPNRSAREVAVFVNDPALREIATALGVELDDNLRDAIAQQAGMVALQQFEDPTGYIEPTITISRATLARHPEILEAVRAAYQVAQP